MLNVKLDLSGLYKKFEGVEAAVDEGAKVGIGYAVDGVENFVKRRIQVTGTYGSKNRFAGMYLPFAGRGRSDGRIDTGRMYDSIEKSVKVSKGFVSASVGWPENSPKYFWLQENGFDYIQNSYPISGKSHHVEGMFAWRDAKTLLNKTAPGLVGSWVKEYARKAGK